MQKDWRMSFTVLADVFAPEPARLDEVHLYCRELPFPTQHVPRHEIRLRPVECSLPDHGLVGDPGRVERVAERLLGARPLLVVSHELVRVRVTQGETNLVVLEA